VDDGPGAVASLSADAGDSDGVTEAVEARRLLLAKAWKRANDVPGRVFRDAMLFVNPPLNILLDLYISHREGQSINVSSVCLGSGAPATTGLRYISRLMEMGLLRKTEDARDHRVQYVALTPAGVILIAQTLDEVASGDRKLGLDRIRLV
jgi:predicted transcriptional regulator